MCTSFKVAFPFNQKGNPDQVAIGRSMEFGVQLNSKLFFRKAGHEFEQNFYNPKVHEECPMGDVFGLKWTGKYGFVGMNAFGQPFLTDGINTEGLYVGALVLRGAQYQEITDPTKGLAYLNFVNWALSKFKNCYELHQALKNNEVQVGNFPGNTDLLTHFAVHDVNNESLVIEYVDGECKIYDNSGIGVMTNDPVFPWQVTNLWNFTEVNPVSKVEFYDGNISNKDKTLRKYQLTNEGSGFSYIPGGQLPAQRFVRAAMMVNYSEMGADKGTDSAAVLASHILNTVDIPEGVVRSDTEPDINAEGPALEDYTSWATISDLRSRTYSVRQYESPLVYSLNITELAKEGGLEQLNGKQVPVPTRQLSIPLSKDYLLKHDLEPV